MKNPECEIGQRYLLSSQKERYLTEVIKNNNYFYMKVLKHLVGFKYWKDGATISLGSIKEPPASYYWKFLPNQDNPKEII